MELLRTTLKGRSADSLLPKLQQLTDGCDGISSYYHEYDYDQDTPGNGFRSFVKIIDSFILRVSTISMQEQSPAKNSLLEECEVFASTLIKSLEVAKIIRQKGVNFEAKESSALDLEVFHRVFQFKAQDLEPLFSDLGPFFLKKEFQNDFKQNMFLINWLSAPLLSKLRMISSHKFAAQILSYNASSMTIKHLKSYSLRQFPVNIFVKLFMRPPGALMSWMTVSRENKWVIRISGPKEPARVVESNEPRGGFIRCLLIKPDVSSQNRNNNNNNKSVILFAHGGGFITGSPEGYADFLSQAARRIGVTVLIPDYAKAPERPYPAGLQDILDVYLFLSSGDQRVVDMIGFVPENILLSGDSAGSNLILSLMFALREIQVTSASNEIPLSVRMPKSLMLQYPSITGFIAVPSTTVLTVDPLLSVGFYALSRSFYAEVEPKLEDELWYKRNPDVKEVMRRFNDRLKDPLFNILAFEDWDDFKSIPLSVVGCEMDAILDHSILLSKKWKGPVKLDIAHSMSHGFLVGTIGAGVAPHVKLCIDRMAEGLGIKTL